MIRPHTCWIIATVQHWYYPAMGHCPYLKETLQLASGNNITAPPSSCQLHPDLPGGRNRVVERARHDQRALLPRSHVADRAGAAAAVAAREAPDDAGVGVLRAAAVLADARGFIDDERDVGVIVVLDPRLRRDGVIERLRIIAARMKFAERAGRIRRCRIADVAATAPPLHARIGQRHRIPVVLAVFVAARKKDRVLIRPQDIGDVRPDAEIEADVLTV